MTYCGLNGFLQSLEEPVENDRMVRVLALFDHEEVGSSSLAGAESTSLRSIIDHLSGESRSQEAIRRSFLLSYVVRVELVGCRMCRMRSIPSTATRRRATTGAF